MKRAPLSKRRRRDGWCSGAPCSRHNALPSHATACILSEVADGRANPLDSAHNARLGHARHARASTTVQSHCRAGSAMTSCVPHPPLGRFFESPPAARYGPGAACSCRVGSCKGQGWAGPQVRGSSIRFSAVAVGGLQGCAVWSREGLRLKLKAERVATGWPPQHWRHGLSSAEHDGCCGMVCTLFVVAFASAKQRVKRPDGLFRCSGRRLSRLAIVCLASCAAPH